MADFYIGYRPRTSPAIAARTRRLVVGLGLGAAVLAAVLVLAQDRFSTAVFEFGHERTVGGHLTTQPYPVLDIEATDDDGPHLLVALGKQGADPMVHEFDGRQVEITGTLIHRDGSRMLELAEPPRASGDATAQDAHGSNQDLGTMRLTGEIVDSKCYLGVMKPGRGKPHRSCAARCISGGSPPLFLLRDREGNEARLLLTGADGRPLSDELLDMVAEPLEIEGEVSIRQGLWYLAAEPSTYRRIVTSER